MHGDPLARALRKRFKKAKEFPKRKFLCVFSDELLQNKGRDTISNSGQCVCTNANDNSDDSGQSNHESHPAKVQVNGTLAHVTAIFGFMLAGLVIKDAVE